MLKPVSFKCMPKRLSAKPVCFSGDDKEKYFHKNKPEKENKFVP